MCVCVCVHACGDITASMETRGSRKDEKLEDEMRTYYSRVAKGLTECGDKSAPGMCHH